LQGAREAGFGVSILVGLLGFAALAARDDPERGAVLCGAAEALRERLAYRIQRLELRVITQTREALATQLSDRFDELTASGAELELDDAVALALES
jgi:hypothetical protein